MTPITWQAAVDDEEQRPLLQDIVEAAVDNRQRAAVDVEEQRPQLQDIFEAAIDGNHVWRKWPRWFPVAFLAVFTFECPSPG